jgi:CheY-like chemotaxis protein
MAAMRVLVVDDSAPRRRLLKALLERAGHEVLSATDGADALGLLEHEVVAAVVSDVKMPKMDGFQLCRALRQDPRWARLPFIFYSTIFIGHPARQLGADLGATAYFDVNEVAPDHVAQALEALVARHVRTEYDETLKKLLDDVEFARRYHQVVLASLGQESGEVREVVASSAQALEAVVSQLDEKRRTLDTDTDTRVHEAELKLLRELGDFLGDKINNPLAVILASAQLLEMKAPSDATTAAAERIGAAVRKINQVVRDIADRSAIEGRPDPPAPAKPD